MGKGVLLELDGRQAVVLTQQGEFKRVPLPRGKADIGDEIEYADVKPSPWAKWGTAAAAAAVLLLAPFGWQAYSLTQPVAIVTMDINPSLQLTLNKADQVLKAEGLNQDGNHVLQGVKWQRKPVDQVVADVTAKAAEARKLNVADASSAVVVAVAPVAEEALPVEQAHRIRDKAYAAISTEVTEQAGAQQVTAKTNLAVLEVTVAEKAEAKAAGITPGKLVISKKLQEKGIEIQPAELKQTGPGKLLHDLGINPDTIFGEAQQEHGGMPATADDKGKDKDKDKDKDDKGNDNNKGNSGQNNQPAQPVTTQPATPGNSDDKGGSNKGKENSGRGSDDSNKQDDDDDKVNGQDNRGNSGKGKNEDSDDRSDEKKGKGNSGNNSKKEAWTLPFGIEVPKPAFMQPKNSNSTSPRAGALEVGASPSEEEREEQEKLQRELDKQRAEQEKEAKKQQEKREKEGK